MFRVHFQHIKEKIFIKSLQKSPQSQAKTFLFLDLRTANGAPQEKLWEILSPLRGELSMLNTGESPSVVVESHLSQILEDNVPEKYYLSPKACQGILRRAERRKKELPEALRQALIQQSVCRETV